MMDGSSGFGWGIGNWILMAALMVFIWGAITTVVVLELKSSFLTRGTRENASNTASAEAVLNDRFARGEIDEVELAERRTALRRTP